MLRAQKAVQETREDCFVMEKSTMSSSPKLIKLEVLGMRPLDLFAARFEQTATAKRFPVSVQVGWPEGQ